MITENLKELPLFESVIVGDVCYHRVPGGVRLFTVENPVGGVFKKFEDL